MLSGSAMAGIATWGTGAMTLLLFRVLCCLRSINGVGVGGGYCSLFSGFDCRSEMREYAMQALVVSATRTSTSAFENWCGGVVCTMHVCVF